MRTGDNVVEYNCGSRKLREEHYLNYLTNCDPRLNAEQALELAFELDEMLNPWLQ